MIEIGALAVLMLLAIGLLAILVRMERSSNQSLESAERRHGEMLAAIRDANATVPTPPA